MQMHAPLTVTDKRLVFAEVKRALPIITTAAAWPQGNGYVKARLPYYRDAILARFRRGGRANGAAASLVLVSDMPPVTETRAIEDLSEAIRIDPGVAYCYTPPRQFLLMSSTTYDARLRISPSRSGSFRVNTNRCHLVLGQGNSLCWLHGRAIGRPPPTPGYRIDPHAAAAAISRRALWYTIPRLPRPRDRRCSFKFQRIPCGSTGRSSSASNARGFNSYRERSILNLR